MIPRLLFYLLLALLPTQIGRHFFFNFSAINGLYSDYLIPVVYLTDIIVFLIIFIQLGLKTSYYKFNLKNLYKKPSVIVLLSVILYLLINVIFVAASKWVALYKMVKITEFILLGFVIIKIKPAFLKTVFFLSIGAFYSSILAIWQFIFQRSIGGFWWYLGERTFSVTTPGIAAFNWRGNLVLRSYATFPHPNILAGFLVVTICLMLVLLINQKRKIGAITLCWLFSVCILSVVGLIFTFSRLSWLFLLVGIIVTFLYNQNIKKNIIIRENFLLLLIFFYIFLSVTIPFFIYQLNFFGGTSLKERLDLANQTIIMISSYPVFGVGLNNSIIQVVKMLSGGFGLYFFQPVHNIYLLITSETGLTGFFLFLFYMSITISKSLRLSSPYLPVVLVLILLGGFDHYLLTLQQGILIFVLFASLAFLPKNDVN